MENYVASTQYNDFIGTSAADKSDTESFQEYLKSNNLIVSDEFLVGYEIVFNENSGRSIPNPGIVAWVTKGLSRDDVDRDAQTNGFCLRAIDVQNLTIADFFKYFKRFNVVLSIKGINLNGADFTTYEN